VGTISTYSNYGGGGGGVVGGGGGGGGHGTVGGTAPDGNSPGGATYGVTELDRLYLGAGGGGGGSYLNVTGGNGGNGGGIIFAAVSTINMTGQIYTAGIDGGAATSSGGGGGGGGGGAGGSIRIEGNNVTAIGATNATPGAGGWYSSPHVQSGGNGGYGRVAVYYTTSFSASISTNYLKHVGVEQSDSLFGSGFETGDLTEWSSSQTDGGHLSVTASSRYWGYFGLKAQIADNNDLYVQDDTPDSETHYRARFYFHPNSITMAAGDTPVIFAGYSGSTQVLRIQLQKAGGVYQVRIGMRSDGGTWSDSGWATITNGWNALEIEWYASVNSGTMKLWVNGGEAQSLNSVDNDASTLTSVRLGLLSVPTGTRGSLKFDDFESRRFSQIGTLPDPGLLPDEPSGGKLYTYGDPNHVHAVTDLSNGDAFAYDANGNMTCRSEGGNLYKQEYNAENRISIVQLIEGSCDEPTSIISTWNFIYDGDGVKVIQVYTAGETTLTTRYYMGGAYEFTSDGTTETVRKYYSIAGISVAMNDGTQLLYFLTDHLGSIVGVTDSSGTLLDEQRYMPFGQVRLDAGVIDQTDFGYTFQRNLPDMGLMDYKARLYDVNMGRFVQADIIVPHPDNPLSWNKYAYVMNSPMNKKDPKGNWDCDWKWGECEDTINQALSLISNSGDIGRGEVIAMLAVDQSRPLMFSDVSTCSNGSHMCYDRSRNTINIDIEYYFLTENPPSMLEFADSLSHEISHYVANDSENVYAEVAAIETQYLVMNDLAKTNGMELNPDNHRVASMQALDEFLNVHNYDFDNLDDTDSNILKNLLVNGFGYDAGIPLKPGPGENAPVETFVVFKVIGNFVNHLFHQWN
jgi:RHS repeat-associated protein